MSKAQDDWAKYASGIPGLDAAIKAKGRRVLNDDSHDFTSFVKDLPGEVSETINDATKHDDIDVTQSIEHHWCLCDMPEGDYPRVYAFPSLQRLVEAINKREGQETAVWPMYGIPLRLTKPVSSSNGKQTRYLLLPNQLAIAVSDTNSKLIDQSLLPDDLAIQEEGWLGDPGYFKENYFIESGDDGLPGANRDATSDDDS